MKCRPGCAACCIAISISSPIPGMPNGKPAGVRCINLDDNGYCKIHKSPDYPKVCGDFKADPEYCGSTRDEALRNLAELERLTS